LITDKNLRKEFMKKKVSILMDFTPIQAQRMLEETNTDLDEEGVQRVKQSKGIMSPFDYKYILNDKFDSPLRHTQSNLNRSLSKSNSPNKLPSKLNLQKLEQNKDTIGDSYISDRVEKLDSRRSQSEKKSTRSLDNNSPDQKYKRLSMENTMLKNKLIALETSQSDSHHEQIELKQQIKA